jgi:hypothetical protein
MDSRTATLGCAILVCGYAVASVADSMHTTSPLPISPCAKLEIRQSITQLFHLLHLLCWVCCVGRHFLGRLTPWEGTTGPATGPAQAAAAAACKGARGLAGLAVVMLLVACLICPG